MIKFRLLSLKTKLYADNPKEVTIMKEGIHPKYEPSRSSSIPADALTASRSVST